MDFFLLNAGLGHVTCFGQWDVNKFKANRGEKYVHTGAGPRWLLG